MDNALLLSSIERLGKEFDAIEWKYLDVSPGSTREKTQLWPGDSTEDVMICVYKGNFINQMFHRQDYFFFNFAYQGDYGALSYQFDNRITAHEGECYIGQPYAGYAPNGQSDTEIIIVGVLIQTQAFFKTFLHVLSANRTLFHFFLNPQINEYSDEYIQLKFEDLFSVRSLLELMIVEYANRQENTQDVLKPLTLALLMQVARQYAKSNPTAETDKLSEKIVQYIGEHFDTVTLGDISAHFSYHPNYISGYIRKELGRSFSEILLEQRMERAIALLKGTDLSIEDIAAMLGYSNNSNFYKAFREYYHMSPREYCMLLSK
ncbi:MAG: AraC family transcriptional regulator [Clostridia bacterium]|nr:AraC family transcriptional regulator [Clostridia bacterium]NCD03405.1 AraC family transcriptional regulator [Clostridia bacterium]